MPPVPAILFIRPSDKEVVALPMILGPKTENTVEHAANTMTRTMAAL